LDTLSYFKATIEADYVLKQGVLTMSLNQISDAIAFFSALVTPNKRRRIESVLTQRTEQLCIVLEDIYQAHNCSAVIRSCEGFGIQNLHIVEQNNAFKVNHDIALGANQWLDIHRYDSSRACIATLRENNYQIAALSLHPDAIPIESIAMTQQLALCIGCEENGLSELVHQEADHLLKIPMNGFTQSFNLSVCAAVVMYQCIQTLKRDTLDWRIPKAKQDIIRLRWYMNAVPHAEKIMARLFPKLCNQAVSS
jgi:tRNA (guanosine-2'-O-)-methyltransferase